MDHSYEEIRSAALDILAEREEVSHKPTQFVGFPPAIAEVFARRAGGDRSGNVFGSPTLSPADEDLFMEVFWDLFRQGIITLGYNRSNNEFPWFRLSHFGKRILDNQEVYFFHDVSTYEGLITDQIPDIDPTTLVYLKEAMQAFRAGCLLSATVMLGVATEHTFLLLLESIDGNQAHKAKFASAAKQRTILQKINKFKGVLDQAYRDQLSPDVKEDLDTHFASILSVIRTFRNQSGHPTGKIIDREQAYILLQLFVPYAKKMYQLTAFFRQ